MKIFKKATVLLVFVMLMSLSAGAISSSHWAINYADFTLDQGMFGGTRSSFDPDGPVSRGRCTHALAVMGGGPTGPNATTGFTDVPYSHQYAKSVKWANNNNIINGTSSTLFSPDNAVTKQDFAVMCYRYSQFKGISLPTDYGDPNIPIVTVGSYQLPDFTDKTEISNYAKPAVLAMFKAGVIAGYDDGSFGPKQSITKAEAAKMLTFLSALQEIPSGGIGVFTKDTAGTAVVSAMVYCYPPYVNENTVDMVAQYYKDYSKGTAPKKGIAVVTGLNNSLKYGINSMTKNMSASTPKEYYPKRRYRFIEIPTNLADRAPISGYTRGHWAHGTCYEPLWAYNDAFCPTHHVTSCKNFGWRYIWSREFHQGIDIGCQFANVYHIGEGGIVADINTDYDPDYGYYVQVKSGNVYITYQHLNSVSSSLVENDPISTGTLIGVSGNTGYGFGYHLHITAGKTSEKYSNDSTIRKLYFNPRVYID